MLYIESTNSMYNEYTGVRPSISGTEDRRDTQDEMYRARVELEVVLYPYQQ